MKTIIVQGAMHTEIEHLINMFPGGQTVTHHGYTFSACSRRFGCTPPPQVSNYRFEWGNQALHRATRPRFHTDGRDFFL